jgi:hypothetical protein
VDKEQLPGTKDTIHGTLSRSDKRILYYSQYRHFSSGIAHQKKKRIELSVFYSMES